MKAAALIYSTVSGEYRAIPGANIQPLLDVAMAARSSGAIGKELVQEGTVLANWKLSAAYKFRCSPAVLASAKMNLKKAKKAK